MNQVAITRRPSGAFSAALSTASPGDWIIYHVGAYCGGPHKGDARAAYEAGLVVLTTRRVSPCEFEFIAVRTAREQGQ